MTAWGAVAVYDRLAELVWQYNPAGAAAAPAPPLFGGGGGGISIYPAAGRGSGAAASLLAQDPAK